MKVIDLYSVLDAMVKADQGDWEVYIQFVVGQPDEMNEHEADAYEAITRPQHRQILLRGFDFDRGVKT